MAPEEGLLLDETGGSGMMPTLVCEQGDEGKQRVAGGQRVSVRQRSQSTPVLRG